MFERFTQPARDAVVSAQQSALLLQHPEIRAVDLLLGALADEHDCAARALRRLGIDRAAASAQIVSDDSSPHAEVSDAAALSSLGIDLDEVRRTAEQTFGTGALSRPRRQRHGLFGHRGSGGHIPFAKESKSALELSLREALARKDGYIGTEHLLLGLLSTEAASVLELLRRIDPGIDRLTVSTAIDVELKKTA